LIGFSAAQAANIAAANDQQRMVDVHLKINSRDYPLKLDPRTSLLDLLREHLQLTGSKKGCDHGQCVACSAHAAIIFTTRHSRGATTHSRQRLRRP